MAVQGIAGEEVVALATHHEQGAVQFLALVLSQQPVDDEPHQFVKDHAIAELFATDDLFLDGTWRALKGNYDTSLVLQSRISEARQVGFVGSEIIGSGIVARFVSACHGKIAWDEMHDPEFYENLLRPGAADRREIKRAYKDSRVIN